VKTKVILLFFILSLGINTKAQNLVFNGDFEIRDTCPDNAGQINRATGWFAAGGTPEYYNACASSSVGVNVPYTMTGYQKDCGGGGGYSGDYMMCNQTTPGDDSCREYIGTKLIDTLKTGHKYLASAYVSRANFNYSIATIGILFTDSAIVLPNPGQGPFFPASPQVKNDILLTDTLNWTLVQDTFIAVGNETHLTLGNFNTTATSDTIMSPGGFGTWWLFGEAYYYIDGVLRHNSLLIHQLKKATLLFF
jgi:hypothetical protein